MEHMKPELQEHPLKTERRVNEALREENRFLNQAPGSLVHFWPLCQQLDGCDGEGQEEKDSSHRSNL